MPTYRTYLLLLCFCFSRRVPTASVGKSIRLGIIIIAVYDKNPSQKTRALYDGTRGLQYEYLMVGVLNVRPVVGGCSGWAHMHCLPRYTTRIFSVGSADRCNCGPAATARDVPPATGVPRGRTVLCVSPCRCVAIVPRTRFDGAVLLGSVPQIFSEYNTVRRFDRAVVCSQIFKKKNRHLNS